MNEVINQIPLGDIVPSGHNRTVGGYDPIKLQELADSISKSGVIQPAVVRVIDGGKFQLVAGERRWRASKLAHMETLPCVIKDIDDETALRMQIIENLQREEIHPLDEADGFRRLELEGHCEVQYIAREVGRSTAYVYQRMKLLDLITEAREMLADGTISVGHALLIARLPKGQQNDALELAIWTRGDGLETRSVKDLDNLIKSHILLELRASTWKADDEKLYPSAGSCKLCSKRTGANPLLFGEDEELKKNDCCTDPECFKEKGRLQVERRREELKDEKHLEVSDCYRGNGTLPKGSLESCDWHECKKKDPGAVRVLVVSGNFPGRLTYGKSTRSATQAELDPDAKAKIKAEKAREKLIDNTEEMLKRSIYQQIKKLASGDDPVIMKPEFQKALLRVFWDRVDHDSKITICKVEGYAVPRDKRYGDDTGPGYLNYDKALEDYLALKDDPDFLDMLITLALAGNVKSSGFNSYRGVHGKFKEAAAAAGLDVDALVASAAESAGITVEELNPKSRYEDFNDDEESDVDEDVDEEGIQE